MRKKKARVIQPDSWVVVFFLELKKYTLRHLHICRQTHTIVVIEGNILKRKRQNMSYNIKGDKEHSK